jgi:hypothetical protein
MLKCNMNEIVKRAHQIGTSLVVTIDPKIIKELKIDEETYLVQKSVNGGILMQIRRLTSDSGTGDDNF